MLKRMVIFFLLILPVFLFSESVGIYEFCLSNDLTPVYNLSVGYLDLTNSDGKVRVFLSIPYVLLNGSELHTMSSGPVLGEGGELLLSDHYQELILSAFSEEETMEPETDSETNLSVFLSESFISRPTSTTTTTLAVTAVTTTTRPPTTTTTSILKTTTTLSLSIDDENDDLGYNDEDFVPINAVIIDAGHGGTDPGGMRWDGAKEKDVVLSIATYLSNNLSGENLHIELTRDDDTFVTLEDRVGISADVAEDYHPIFVSIHANISLDSRVEGIEVYSLSESASDDDAKLVMQTENQGFKASDIATVDGLYAVIANLIRDGIQLESDELSECVYDALIDETGAVERGTKKAGFYVLKYNLVPSILVEVGFLSHSDESDLLLTDDYQKELADGLEAGIIDFIDKYNDTRGFSE